MQTCKSIVPMAFECYLFITPACSCIVRNDGVSLTRIVGRPLSTQNFRSTVYMVYLFLHDNIVRTLLFQEVKGLTKAYAPDQTKTCLHAKFQVHWNYS